MQIIRNADVKLRSVLLLGNMELRCYQESAKSCLKRSLNEYNIRFDCQTD